jgi:ssDNA-binding Zn-finger/Zn-ribbon topoisomerase 1
MRKKLPEITLSCPNCGKTPPKDEIKFNENWSVIPAVCPECEVRLKINVNYPLL